MSLPTLKYIAWREQPDFSVRPRFKPGPHLRRINVLDCDLKDPHGAWLNVEQAVTWWRAKMDEIKSLRETGKRAKKPAAASGNLVGDLLDDWLKSDRVSSCAKTTRRGYKGCVEAIKFKPQTDAERKAKTEKTPEKFAQAPVTALAAPEIVAFYEYQKRTRGWHMALACRAVLRAALSWARTSTKWRLKYNPARELDLAQPAGRVVIFADTEIRALVAAADAMQRSSMGDAIFLGLFTGQRQSDRRLLEDAGLHDGRRMFRQSKTKAVVAIPETPQLRARLETAVRRRAEIVLAHGTRPSTIVIDETTGTTYNEHTFRHVFADVRALAVTGSIELGLVPCPSLAGKRDQDLRDTAVTWLARAGCTPFEIASITGHSLQSIHGILRHYLAITPEFADAAIGKLVAWMEKEGVAV